MIKFTCDKCGHDEYEVTKKEIFVFDMVDCIDVYFECTKCEHQEQVY